jgi:hypothetical protein
MSFYSSDGQAGSTASLYTPFSLSDVVIYDAVSGGNVVASGLTPVEVTTGVYQISWAVGSSQASGTYYDQWAYVPVSGADTHTRRVSTHTIEIIGAGTPARTSILADIKSTLEAITAANGYKTTVNTVEPYLRSRNDVQVGNARPYLAFGPDRENYTHNATQEMRAVMPWTIVGYTNGSGTWATASAEINKLIDDVIAAVMADPTLGGNAVQTVIKSLLTDEARDGT